QRGDLRQQRRRRGGGLSGGHERHRDHPEDRPQGEEGDHRQRAVHGQPLHGSSLQRRRRAAAAWPAVTARVIANSRKATAEAEARFHHLKPSSYMKYRTLVVLWSGPPCVITYGSAKSWK